MPIFMMTLTRLDLDRTLKEFKQSQVVKFFFKEIIFVVQPSLAILRRSADTAILLVTSLSRLHSRNIIALHILTSSWQVDRYLRGSSCGAAFATEPGTFIIVIITTVIISIITICIDRRPHESNACHCSRQMCPWTLQVGS